MGLAEARKYIAWLHKKQNDPGCWPDYVTGLPGRAATLRQLDLVYPRLGRYAASYIRISNIYPFLIKYGYEHHTDLIEWAAAILKTTADRVRGSFVGTMDSHDFVVISRRTELDGILEAARVLFAKKARSLYSPEDRRRGVIISFKSAGGGSVRVGLMGLVCASAAEKPPVSRADFLPYLAGLCSRMEKAEKV
ncbi:MAG: hypothetical protein M0Z58_02300 [Nitrospiraceae bacterium]|nr:hypothetical protein [Nitrospiraceae bacterium]